MNPGIIALAAAGGFIGYKALQKDTAAAQQPEKPEKMPFWTSWLDGGGQPQTGNGTPKTDIQVGMNLASDLAKFGTSLVSYFGTSDGSGGTGNGLGTQTDSYAGGKLGHSGDDF